jgi:hypothetical protein
MDAPRAGNVYKSIAHYLAMKDKDIASLPLAWQKSPNVGSVHSAGAAKIHFSFQRGFLS